MKSQSLKRSISSLLWKTAVLALIQSNVYAQKTSHPHPHTNIGLVYPLSSNGKNAARDTNTFSLNILAGVSAAERGVTIAGVSNIIRHDA